MNKIYDIAIVGGGPAGLTAAIYGLRNGNSVIVVEKEVFGGQINNSHSVLNIPGFKEISGDEYGDLLLNQVDSLGGEFIFDECIGASQGELLTLHLRENEDILAKTLILATGTVHRSLNTSNEEGLIGKSVHFCAVCDGNLYKDKTVVLIGGGNSALCEATLLASTVRELIILQDMPYFTAENSLIKQISEYKNVKAYFNVEGINYVLRNDSLKGVSFHSEGKFLYEDCDGVFLAIGLVPNNDAFKDLVSLDENGYYIADESGKTYYGNIFVAGDCRSKQLRQVVSACSDGANCAISASKYIKDKELL